MYADDWIDTVISLLILVVCVLIGIWIGYTLGAPAADHWRYVLEGTINAV